MSIRDYMKSNERFFCFGIKINHQLKHDLFEFFRYKKRNKRHDAAFNDRSKKPDPECNDNRSAMNISILACQPGQSFWIGPDVQIIVLGSSQKMVHLGIEVPIEAKFSRNPFRVKEGVHE